MATANPVLIGALREAASRLKNGAHYSWGNHGACNCGQLLQVITRMDEKQILQSAHSGVGEWTELAADYCPVSGVAVDELLSALQSAGLTPVDIHHLEYLDDKAVLSHLDGGFRWLKRNRREDAIIYFEAFANMLEAMMPPASVRKKFNRAPLQIKETYQRVESPVYS